MPGLGFDHLALGAFDLEQGVQWFANETGLAMPPGGTHPLMGTHNHLTAMGNDGFVEIIAIDHTAPRPVRKRWFGMDDEQTRRQISRGLVPLSWVVATPDIDASLAIVKAHGFDIGPAIEVGRGDLIWRISVRNDGLVPQGGTLPVLIQWPEGPHPRVNMADIGIRLGFIKLYNDTPAELLSLLEGLGCAHVVEVVMAEGRGEGIEVGLSLPGGRMILFGQV